MLAGSIEHWALVHQHTIQALVAIGTIGLAVFTAIMAKKTSELGKDTLEAMDQAERHHRDLLRPVVTVQDALLKLEYTDVNEEAEMILTLVGDLINVGPGPATEVSVEVRPDGAGSRNFKFGMIGANRSEPLAPKVSWHDHLTLDIDGRYPFELIVRYVDLFGKSRVTELCNPRGMQGETYVTGIRDVPEPPPIAVRPL
jgi:hypothetical protein